MKTVAVLFAVILLFASCKKNIEQINPEGVYSKWPVATINVQSYMAPVGVTWDTTYNAGAGDYIDLSTKGEIDFYINQQHRVDNYDTSKYNLLTDTLIAVSSPGLFGGHYVSLTSVSNTHITLKETIFGVDTGTETYYKLGK